MKFKPITIINNLNDTCEEVRHNENTIGIITSINSDKENSDKKDYSTISLISIMSEKGLLKHKLINESFEEAKKVVKLYEGK